MPSFKASTALLTNLTNKGRTQKQNYYRRDGSYIHEKYPKYFARKLTTIIQDKSLSEFNSFDNISDNKHSDTGSDSTVVHMTPINENERLVLSCQFTFFKPKDYNIIHEVIFILVSENRLPFERMLSWLHTQFNSCPAYKFKDARRWRATFLWKTQSYEPDLIAKCSNIQGGLVTLRPSFETFKAYQNPKYFYPVQLSVRDSKCFAPVGKRSLKNLGAAISLPNIELPYEAIVRMDAFFKDYPILFFEYAINDSVICLLYSAQLWGFNKYMPVTTTSGAAHVAAFLIMSMAIHAYAGGFNSCLGAEYVNSLTYDYDLQNAYPTAMSCISDPDWTISRSTLRGYRYC